jgi:hypothetical protein
MIMIQAQERLGGGRGITKPRKSRASPSAVQGPGFCSLKSCEKTSSDDESRSGDDTSKLIPVYMTPNRTVQQRRESQKWTRLSGVIH